MDGTWIEFGFGVLKFNLSTINSLQVGLDDVLVGTKFLPEISGSALSKIRWKQSKFSFDGAEIPCLRLLA